VSPPGEAWYRQPLVWMLIAIPVSAVLMGVVIIVLAIRTDDGLVVDDYYRRGKEINRVIVRDEAAARYGVAASINLDTGKQTVIVKFSKGRLPELPSRLDLSFYHATRSGVDRKVQIVPTREGYYYGLLPDLPPGRWHAQLEGGDWRLTGSLVLPGEHHLELRPPKI